VYLNEVKIMTSDFTNNNFYKHVPLTEQLNSKNRLTSKSIRRIISVFNTVQIAFAESYLNGLEVNDRLLKRTFDIIIPILYKHFSSLLITHDWILEESELLAEDASHLMKLQYNLPREMFCSMLGEDDLIYPKYTMALWEKGAENLRQAQIDMLDDAIIKAGIQDGDEILDLGCGWGSAANYILSKFPNAKVTGLNLSHEQCEYIRGKMQDSKSYLSSARFTLVEEDFNQVNFATKFDKIFSFGVLEHIGNMTKSLDKISSFLQENGKVFIHIISTHLPHNMFNPFIDKYIFPRARIWHYDVISNCQHDLKTINKWFINGSNYSQTLQAWLRNFDQSQDKIKNLDYGMEYARFRRMWRLYLILCIAYFDGCDGKIMGNGQYLMVDRA
jgi:cyclopropane-fatty-acyl-phospholipid synthase